MEIKISGYDVIIDDDDFEKVISAGKWHKKNENGKIYFVHTISKSFKMLYLHRLICPPEKGLFVDHINGNTLDNRKCNLRVCTHAENMKNQKRNSLNTSGYKGVSFNRQYQKWKASITTDGVRYFLGYFPNPETAYAEYCKAAEKYHGKFSRVN